MELILPAEIQPLIDDRIRSGRYRSADEVVVAAIANLSQHDRLVELGTSELETVFPNVRKLLADGLGSARSGRLVDGEDFFAALEQEESSRTSADRKTA